jgi:general secretion pathway protein E
MRQDPDIIMIGEIRDKETADMAVQAALTGHLVFASLHTNDAASSVARLIELGVPHYLVNSTLIGILAQRLIRTLCPHCKVPTEAVDPALWEELVAPWHASVPKTINQPVGCLECRRTGYLGRTGLIELMRVNDAVRALIGTGCDIQALRNQGARDGMRSLRVSGADKIAKGLTTFEEVFKAAPPFKT